MGLLAPGGAFRVDPMGKLAVNVLNKALKFHIKIPNGC